MIRANDMVRLSGGRMMRVLQVFGDYARCVFVDAEGRIRSRWFVADDLHPWWLTAGPRCLWPEVTDLPDDPSIMSTDKRRKRTKPKASKKLKKASA